ncbi:hypothetical protein [Halolamina salina]|uniref:SR1 protein n=1 Tax=Halolamina salina TaxID=1220023 RepID=A0ABD6B3P2_9EURY
MTCIEIECDDCAGTLSHVGGPNCDELLECDCGSQYVVTISKLDTGTVS